MVALPCLTGFEVLRVLVALGFSPVDRGGNLVQLAGNLRSVLVPMSNEHVAPDELRLMLRAAGVTVTAFVEALDQIDERRSA